MPDLIPIPEVSFIYLPWVGCLSVLAGISVIFVSFAVKNANVPRFTLLSVPLLLGSYSIFPLIIASGNLLLLGNLSYPSPPYIFTTVLFLLFSIIGQLLMVWGSCKAVKPYLWKSSENEMKLGF